MSSSSFPKYQVFVCLMASLSEDGSMHTKVCRASNLARNLSRHNRKVKCLDPSTKEGAPHWEYVIILGPFKHGHRAVAHQWKGKGTKKLSELTARGLKIGADLSSSLHRNVLYCRTK